MMLWQQLEAAADRCDARGDDATADELRRVAGHVGPPVGVTNVLNGVYRSARTVPDRRAAPASDGLVRQLERAAQDAAAAGYADAGEWVRLVVIRDVRDRS